MKSQRVKFEATSRFASTKGLNAALDCLCGWEATLPFPAFMWADGEVNQRAVPTPFGEWVLEKAFADVDEIGYEGVLLEACLSSRIIREAVERYARQSGVKVLDWGDWFAEVRGGRLTQDEFQQKLEAEVREGFINWASLRNR